MTNEEITREATGQITDGRFEWRQSNKVEQIYAIILAAIKRAQSEDKARIERDAIYAQNSMAHELAQETLEDDAEFEAWWQKFRNHIDMDGETKSDCKLAWKAARKRLRIHKTK